MPTSGKRSHKPATSQCNTSQCNHCINQRHSNATTTALISRNSHGQPHQQLPKGNRNDDKDYCVDRTGDNHNTDDNEQRSCGRDLSPTLQRPPPPPQPKNIKPLQTTIPNYRRHRPKILDKASGHKSSSLVPYGWSSQTVLPHPPVRPSVCAASPRHFASPRLTRQLRNFLLLNRTNWLLKQTVNLKLSLHRQPAARPDSLYMNTCVAWTFQVWTIKLQ